MAGAAIGQGALGLINAWKTNNTGAAVLTGAATGASIGTMILPGIGTAIGAVGGALVGVDWFALRRSWRGQSQAV